MPPQLPLRSQRKIPPLNSTEAKSATEVSIAAAEVTANGAVIAEIAATEEVVVAELQKRTRMDSLWRLARNLSQEAEEASVETTEVATEVTGVKEAMKEGITEAIARELEVASAQKRRELLNLPSHRISNEKFERRFGI